MFSFPRILLKYWTLAWLSSFLLSIFFFSSILVLFTISEDIEKYVDLCLNSPVVFFNVTFLTYLPWIIPICCFTGTILTFYIFEKNLEWSSLKACAVSPLWISGTILLISALISIIPIFFTISQKNSLTKETSENKIGFTMKVGKQSSWFFQSFNRIKMTGENLQIYFYDEHGNDALRMRCQKAFWSEDKGWIFQNGVYLSFQTERGIPVPVSDQNKIEWQEVKNEPFYKESNTGKTPLRKLRFKELSLGELNENPKLHILLSEKPANLSFQKLKEINSGFSNVSSRVLAPFRFQYAKICVGFLSSLFATITALLLVARTERKSFSKIFPLILCGIVAFYVTTRFADPLGEIGILNEWTSATVPYLSVILLIALIQIRFPRKKFIFQLP